MTKRKKNKKSIRTVQDNPRVPRAVLNGIIEGYPFPYNEPLLDNTQLPIVQLNQLDDDPITYYKETRGSGLSAIRSLKF